MRGDAYPPAPGEFALINHLRTLLEDYRVTIPAVAAYLGALALLPWLTPVAVLCAAGVALAALAFMAHRAGSARSPAIVAGLWPVLHLTLLATGGLGSPLLPIVTAWLILAAAAGGQRLVLIVGALAGIFLLLGDALGETRGAGALIETALVLLTGGFAAWVLDRDRRRALAHEEALRRIHDDIAYGRGGEAAEAAIRVESLAEALERVREAVGARRVVLWDIDVEAARARPRVAQGGDPPGSVHLQADPLRWAWEEAMPLRLETPPSWAGTAARSCIVPLEPRAERSALLTMDFDEDRGFPSSQVIDEAAGHLRAFLALQAQEARTVAIQERFSLLADVLQRLPREVETGAVAAELAHSAIRLGNGTGAAVALWEDGVGRLLAVIGDDGVPTGAVFGPLESEMAVAAVHGVKIVKLRRRADARTLPLAVPGERWAFEPRSIAVVPLIAPGLETVGVLALWRQDDEPFDDDTVEFLTTLGPFAALQLRQSRAFGDLKVHAERDPLTGLANRRAFEARLARETERARNGLPLAMLVVDVDHFKAINDRYGHEAGDAVLAALGALLQASVRDADLPARFGGEEFVVLLPGTDLPAAAEIAERIRRRVESSPVDWNDRRIDVRVSIGVSAMPDCVDEPDRLFESADDALYAAKEGGRNQVVIAEKQDPGFGILDSGW